ncbi:hypothetical protein J1N35_005541 [Gossypium stocksii]|uniref:Reverse transcriptase zinc-binding domain-containing protein n=1 Tax=Gossypium stocksii TaxID=47602 RepID=A0A9D3WE03_9ROSI|nr:hypothetical protein J1N35_005541 [Gossypium stocksii]
MGLYWLFWKIIWKLKTLPKVQVFIWRLGHENIPTNNMIASIRPTTNPSCQCYGAENETLLHAIKDCPSARAILYCSGLDDRLINRDFENCIDWLEELP